MESVKINAKIAEKKKVEFFHTSEALKTLIQPYCSKFEINLPSKDEVEISIQFDSEKQAENYNSRNEFVILKGMITSLCDDVVIKIDDVLVN